MVVEQPRRVAKKWKRVSENVVCYDDGYWIWYLRKPRPEAVQITGKYLFFSQNREILERIAIHEIETNDFYKAKIPREGEQIGEYVLCLYYKDDSRRIELAKKYRDHPNVDYRYWKSDRDTLEGKYSEKFLAKLGPQERKLWSKVK